MSQKVSRALVSVTDKTGIAEFVKELSDLGIEILSTGGTAKVIKAAGIPVIDVSEFTGSPECFDGRVKTLHPKVHGGILNQRKNTKHQEQKKELGIKDIDLVIVNLYAFEKTVAKEGVAFEDAIENIDIGGPSMVRSAAKNHQDVGIVTEPADYARVLSELKENNGILSDTFRKELCLKAFQRTAEYDKSIATYLEKVIVKK
jgi:phosphoribosylaminoimidazolecarboxamide formyltransferase/IMP cyclohydrolase